MDHQIELGYLVLEVPDPDTLAPVFADVVGLVPGEPTAAGTDTWRNDQRAHRLLVQAGPANDAVAIGFEAVDAAAFDAIIARLRRMGAEVADGDGRRAARVQRLVRTNGPVGRRRRGRPAAGRRAEPHSPLRWSPAASSPTASASGTRCSPRPRSRSPMRSSPKVSASPSRTGSRPSSRPASTSKCASTTATRRHHTIALARAPFELPQRLHHIMFELKRARRRRRRLRPRVGDRPRHPERARPSRQRRHVQLLPADSGRLPDRGRPRRPGDHRGLEREPPLRPDQRLGTPAAARRHERRHATPTSPSSATDRSAACSAILLAQLGRSVAVLERWPGPYPLPRAVHFDHEVGRILQSCGIGDELRAISEPADIYEWRKPQGTTLLRFGQTGDGPSGWPASSMFNQPDARAAAPPSCLRRSRVDVRRGVEVDGTRAARRPCRSSTGADGSSVTRSLRRRVRRRQQHGAGS